MPPTEGPALGPPPQDYRPSRGHEAADHSMRNLALAAAAIAAVVAGGVWMLSGHHQPAAIPVIEPDATPLRIKPANPGGMQVAGADDALPADPHAEENDRLAPPPEAPAPQELRAESHAAAAPALAPPPPAAPPPAVPSPAVPSPAAVSPAAPPPHAVASAAVPPPADLAPIPLPTASERHGGSFVQLAALDSEAAAHAAWAQLTQRMPEVLGGRTPKIERTVHDGHVFWRLRAGPFADIAAATTFCARIRGHGAACTLASF